MVFYSSVRRKLFFARKVFKSTYHIPPDLFSPSRSINKKESRPNKFKVIVTYNWYMSENKECIEKKPAQHSYLFRSINMFWSYLFASPQKQLQLCLNLIVWFEWKEEFCRRPKATNCSSNQSFYWCVFSRFFFTSTISINSAAAALVILAFFPYILWMFLMDTFFFFKSHVGIDHAKLIIPMDLVTQMNWY